MVSLDYYDKLLIGIATSVLGGVLLSVATAVSLQTGITVGAAVATVFVYDAVFRNPPQLPTDPNLIV